MYIVAIGWLYVVLMFAIGHPSVVGGVLSFLFYGLLPAALFFWLAGRRARRSRMAADELPHAPDGQDARRDE